MVALRSLFFATALQGTGLPTAQHKTLTQCAAFALLTFLFAPVGAAAQAGLETPSSLASGGFCAPPSLGAPCATGGVASEGNREPIPALAVGNPVHLATGNKYQLEVDLPPNPSAPGLELIRHYNGLSTQAGVLGRNWTLSYDTRLRREGDQWWLIQADGSRRVIGAPMPAADGHVLTWPDGRRLRFDSAGHLIGIRASAHHSIHIERHAAPHRLAGLVKRVHSANGHALEFHYLDRDGHPLLQAVDTPLGRFLYHYEQADAATGHRMHRLASVTRPDGMQRLYHYEPELQSGNPYALTGISLRAPQRPARRLTTWQYDRFSRVTRHHSHGRDVPELHIDYVHRARDQRPGLTRLTYADGTQSTVRFAHIARDYRLLSRHTGGPAQKATRAVYDEAGRLILLGDTRLTRAPDGFLKAIEPDEPGWPGLRIEHEPTSGQLSWHSKFTGTTILAADRAGRPWRLQHASGHTLLLTYDAQGRPTRLEHGAPDGKRVRTQLQWRGARLQGIEHPHETEALKYDQLGRFLERHVSRPAWEDAPPFSYRETFISDDHGRLLRHTLPEGGALVYTWHSPAMGKLSIGPEGSLKALHWEDPQGRKHTVIDSDEGRAGYRHGNGLRVTTAAIHGRHADTLVLSVGKNMLWRQSRQFDEHGRVLRDTHEYPGLGLLHSLDSHYDAHSRLISARETKGPEPEQWWYAWHADGRLAAALVSGREHSLALQHDASGLPREAAGLTLEYGPQRRLESLSGSEGLLARYRHNAYGHRVTKRRFRAAGNEGATSGDETVHFLFVSNRLVAEAHQQGEAFRVTRRYLYAGHVVVGMIDYPSEGPPRLYAVHADLSGVPRMLTDQDQVVRWLARYTPTGKALQVVGDISFPLRFPGQYEDAESGWHDNLLRTYVPSAGQYLEPDPMGPAPGTQVYGYADQQPWRFADPYGLLLFAFDGTRYSADSVSNAWLLAQAYRDGPTHYHSGPGNSQYLDWDAIVAWRAGQILENQWQALLASLEQRSGKSPIPIDIIGFSRGAAMARHFGNRIAAHVNNGMFSVDDPLRGRVMACVDLRFMGLFDSVAQFGIAGSHNHLYDFGVSEMWSWVAHAVALHEHRWAFPLLSADAGGAGNVVEVPFVGAHADIGGGVALLATDAEQNQASADDSDLAKVALAWMHWQAQAASVSFDQLDESSLTMQAPYLRDMRSPLMRTVQRGDRAIQAPSGALRLTYQDDDPRLGRNTREQTETFIERAKDWRRQDGERVGEVDMAAYARWLEETLGWSP